MAYMSQEHKARIRDELKKVIPKSWKWSLAVGHHSTICLTIAAAPVDLIAASNKIGRETTLRRGFPWNDSKDYIQVNNYHLDLHFEGQLLALFKRIVKALNLDNWDKSDIMTDYFNVGHYVSLNIGRWNKPFEVTKK